MFKYFRIGNTMVTVVEFSMRIISVVIVFLMFTGNVFGKTITSVHGFKYKMPDNYKLLNNINIQDIKKIVQNGNSNESLLGLLAALEKQMENVKIEYLFYIDWGGDAISFTSAPRKDVEINNTNIQTFCNAQLQILQNSAKKKIEGYDCFLSSLPQKASWAVMTNYVNPFTNNPTNYYSVEFASSSFSGKRFVVSLICGPDYCSKLTDDFLKVLKTISFD